jgi:hypothetical protein
LRVGGQWSGVPAVDIQWTGLTTFLKAKYVIILTQKVPQATSPISGTFSYNLRDLYVSFTDATRNNWSILFDSVDTVTTFTRAIMCIMCHVRCHAPGDGKTLCRF